MTVPFIGGISGASDAVFGVRMLQTRRKVGVPTHIIVSRSAAISLKEEPDTSAEQVRTLPAAHYADTGIGAAVSSGSFERRGMVIEPCSVRTLSEIAYGTTANLLSRAADVFLKERRKLVLMVGEVVKAASILDISNAVTPSLA
jgi:4-hydroxy-3-polyprenylbenzoate decarboxylase